MSEPGEQDFHTREQNRQTDTNYGGDQMVAENGTRPRALLARGEVVGIYAHNPAVRQTDGWEIRILPVAHPRSSAPAI